MIKFLVAVCLLFTFAFSISAQTQKDYDKNEMYIGFVGLFVDEGTNDEFRGGVQASYVRNVHRFVGFKVDVSTVEQSERIFRNRRGGFFDDDEFNRRRRTLFQVSTVMGGVEIKDNASEKKVKPFGHALVGVGYLRDRLRSRCEIENCASPTPDVIGFTDTGLSAAFGGGLDIKLSRNITLRAVQADYNPIRFGGFTSNNVRVSAGIVIKGF